MLRTPKPRNARSKRAMEARAPRDYEAAKKAIFVTGPHSSRLVSLAFKDLAALKKPDNIQFNKKNDCLPFESSGTESLEFWSGKNDASLFIVGNHQKKRKDNLIWARCFDGKVLDLLEMGVLQGKAIAEFKSPFSPTIGSRPLFHFSGPHFSPEDSAVDADAPFSGALSMCNSGIHASFQHLKSLLIDFYRGEEAPPASGPGAVPGAAGNSIALRDGLQHIICVTEGPELELGEADAPHSDPDLAKLYAAGAAQIKDSNSPADTDTSASGRIVYFRVYAPRPAVKTQSGATPKIELHEVGPSFDFVLRRRRPADATRLTNALKRPRTAALSNKQGTTKRKNILTDDMGDMLGRVHMERQDLGKLQTRKMKGLKRGRGEDDEEDEDQVGNEDESEDVADSGEEGFDEDDMRAVVDGEDDDDEDDESD
ncbi:Brix-domain-containing protein [Ceraceosorus guamensis]|uniref:Ribosome production factor 2 homolog n=1 Tax=Ceraceosorus guamensis TaxID=1522189 RepID=A0A316VWZ3_9BASI|nr:Brix-domain-containing protein [Ceraceosorus guamensis]PWN42136.1 Brix-domain-containing protein [Ceraceosorus guamensis]